MQAFCYGMMAGLLLLQQAWGAVPRMSLVREGQALNLLVNGDLESERDGSFAHWRAWKQGYQVVRGAGRDGSTAAFCQGPGTFGLGQTVTLDQKSPNPVLVRGWSKARQVSGGRDSGYSIYVDVIYQDGEPLWGQNAPFDTGTHDWQQQRLTILPTKPIRTLTVYGLFRGHAGEVWFDDFEVTELGSGEAATFDGMPVTLHPISPGEGQDLRTEDGLTLSWDPQEASVSRVQVDGRDITASGIPSGFLVRDAAADSDFYGFQDGVCEPLQLELAVAIRAAPTHLTFTGRVTDKTGQDRAITLVFALPVEAFGWQWYDDVRHVRAIEPPRVYQNVVNMGTGATGALSLYPWAAIGDETTGLALGIDMDHPAQYRLGYNAGTRQFFIAYDFGLSPDTANFPQSAEFAFVLYRIDAAWGFRSATQRFYMIFPQHFVRRSRDQGIWMPFTDVSTVEGWEDFGFKYHEGINNVPFDDSAGILSFRYTEPSTWWMRMPPEVPRTHEGVMQVFQEALHSTNPSLRRNARAVQVAGSYDAQGRLQYLIRNTPWCDGAVFSTNPSPYLPGESEARMVWNEAIKRRLYGPEAQGEQDGEYLDSLEGYVTANENFRREHFRYVTVPLTFSTVSKRPVIHKMFSTYEFTKWLAEDLHAMGKLLFANAVPHRFAFLAPWIDVMGTETNWIRDGQWHPPSDAWMNFKRAMSAKKPYLFLMNTRYDAFTPDLVEKYFQRCLFYGMYPSMFSHNAAEDPYWRNPRWYNRDRHLFKRYIPLIKQVAEAGWEPIPYATSDNRHIYVERFGPDEEGHVYFTFLNDSGESQTATIRIEGAPLNLAEVAEVTDRVSGERFPVHWGKESGLLQVPFASEQVRVFPLHVAR